MKQIDMSERYVQVKYPYGISGISGSATGVAVTIQHSQTTAPQPNDGDLCIGGVSLWLERIGNDPFGRGVGLYSVIMGTSPFVAGRKIAIELWTDRGANNGEWLLPR